MTPWANWNEYCPSCGLKQKEKKSLKEWSIFLCMLLLLIIWIILCFCAGIIFFPMVKWVSYVQLWNGYPGPLGNSENLVQKFYTWKLCIFLQDWSCSYCSFKTMVKCDGLFLFFFNGLLIWSVYFNMICERASSQLKTRYPNTRGDLYLQSNCPGFEIASRNDMSQTAVLQRLLFLACCLKENLVCNDDTCKISSASVKRKRS